MPIMTRGRKAKAKPTASTEVQKPEEASTTVEPTVSSDLAASHAKLQAEMAEMKKQLAKALTLKEHLPAEVKETAATAAAEPVIEYVTIPPKPEPRLWAGESSKLGRYNGKTDLDAFLIQFENFAEYQRWDESRRVFNYE